MTSSRALIPLVVLVVFLTTTAPHAASDYPSDAKLKEIETRLAIDGKSCDTNKNPMKMVNCHRALREAQEHTASMRGTREYAKATYLGLATPELEKIRVDLMKQQDRAREVRDFSRTFPRPPGELTKESLGVELGVIEDELRRRGRSRDESNIEQWKKMEGKNPQ